MSGSMYSTPSSSKRSAVSKHHCRQLPKDAGRGSAGDGRAGSLRTERNWTSLLFTQLVSSRGFAHSHVDVNAILMQEVLRLQARHQARVQKDFMG